MAWYHLSSVAERQEQWSEAERCSRESLSIDERIGNTGGAAACNQLAGIAQQTGRPIEAEGWYRRALGLLELTQPGGAKHAAALNNLAVLLTTEIQTEQAAPTRLVEAKHYAELALALSETLGEPSIWKNFGLLALIADLEGQFEVAHRYQRRARETYAAFAGHRHEIDNVCGELITVIATAAQDLPEAQAAIEATLLEQEAEGWRIADAAHCILAGERNWHKLVENLNNAEALLILRILETIASTVQQTTAEPEAFTYEEYLQESGLGEEEWKRGNLHAALARFTRLLIRIEALPVGTRLGQGSYNHSLMLVQLARCLLESRRPTEAERYLRQALVLIDALIQQQPEEAQYQRHHEIMLMDLADILKSQGQYSQARDAYEEALEITKRTGDRTGQAITEGQMGTLAFIQRDYAEAQARYLAALQTFQAQDEPAAEANAWHDLGLVAEVQKDFSQAERCYRASLAIQERLGNVTQTAGTCNQLAIVAEQTGRPSEAEGWYRRALEQFEQVSPRDVKEDVVLNNLASLLVSEIQAKRVDIARLAEAKRYAERARVINETGEVSETWMVLGTLASIADLEGQPEVAQRYRRRERETYAAFAGHRNEIDRQFGQIIAITAAAVRGYPAAQTAIEEVLPQLTDLKMAAATRCVLAGERDWHALAEDLGRNSALVILRVLETIAAPEEEVLVDLIQFAPEVIFASLPTSILEALQQGDQVVFKQALAALTPKEQQLILAFIQVLQKQAEDG